MKLTYALTLVHNIITTVVGKLFRVAGQKQTLQGMAAHTKFPPTIPFLLLLLNLGNLLHFNQINS